MHFLIKVKSELKTSVAALGNQVNELKSEVQGLKSKVDNGVPENAQLPVERNVRDFEVTIMHYQHKKCTCLQ